MVVGVYYIELHIPGIRSRKEKRSIINRIKQKLRNRHNISVSEVAFMDLLQRSALGISTANNSRVDIEKCFTAIDDQINSMFEVQVTKTEIEIL